MGLREAFLFVLLVFSLMIADAQNLEAVENKEFDLMVIPDETEIRVPEVIESNSQLCSVCENLTVKAVEYLTDNKIRDEIKEFLHGICSQTMYMEGKCLVMVDSYVNRLFTEISKINPEGLCKEVALCEKKPIPTLVGSESTCVFCHHIVDEVLAKLKDPDSELEIIELLLKECSRFEGYVQQCKRMILQYGPIILVNGEKFFEKNDICGIIRACPSTQKDTLIRLFAEDHHIHRTLQHAA